MKTITIILFCLALFPINGVAQSGSSYHNTLKKMFEVTGAEHTYTVVIKQMLGMFKNQFTNVPDSLWEKLGAEMQKTSVDDLVVMLMPVYQKHLTESDLQKVIDFYLTPAGKKYADKTPLLLEESMAVGQQWGMKVGQRLQQRLKEEGY